MPENLLYKTALSKSMTLCSRKEHCCDDMMTKLNSWGIGRIDAEKIIKVLINEKFIDEQRFAKAFVSDKFNYNKWGKIKITYNLKLKKIPSEIINNALNSIDTEIYTKVLSDLIAVQSKKVKVKNQYDLKAKLMRYGLSKGFEINLLYEILGDTYAGADK